MKKIFALLLALMLLLSACGQVPEETEVPTETTAATEATEAAKPQAEVFYPRWTEETEPATEPKDFSGVDESAPNGNGVYEIYSAEGLKQLSAHPEAKFKILDDIDLGGAQWTPVAEFTGELEGQGYVISNFTVAAAENTGFIGVNKGTIKNVKLESVSITVESGIAGGIVAVNEGTMTGCTVTGTMALSGDVLAGGIVGKSTAGSFIICDCGMDIRAAESVQLGLIVGEAKDTEFNGCKFNGPMNLKGDKLFNEIAASKGNATFKDCLWRDSTYSDLWLEETDLAQRQSVRAITHKMGTVEWTPSVLINYMHPTAGQMGRVFIPGTTYYGMPYTSNFGPLERFMYCFNEDGSMKDIATKVQVGYDGMDLYMGCDCSGGVYWGWVSVSPSTQWWVTNQMFPALGLGTLPVGQYEGVWELEDTMQICKLNDAQTMGEAYAQLQMADAIMTFYTNPDDASDHFNHTRLIVENPVVLRKLDGSIDMLNSYFTTHEQGSNGRLNSSWRIYGQYTFQQVYDTHYIPLTCQELKDGKAPELVVTVDNAGEGKAYMATGLVQSNYRLIATRVEVTDSEGNEVYEKTIFTHIRRTADSGIIEPARWHITEQDLAAHAAYLGEMELESGKTYTYTLTAITGAGEVEVKCFDFVE